MLKALFLLAALAALTWTASFFCSAIHNAEKLNTIFKRGGSMIFLAQLILTSLSVTVGTFAVVAVVVIVGQHYLLELIIMNSAVFLLAITLAFFIASFTTINAIINRWISRPTR